MDRPNSVTFNLFDGGAPVVSAGDNFVGLELGSRDATAMLVMATPAELAGAPTLNGLRSQTYVTAPIELNGISGGCSELRMAA